MSAVKKKKSLEKSIFYLDNACKSQQRSRDDVFVGKVEKYLKKLKPKKVWKERGLLNKKLNVNVFPDFILLLKGKLIACEIERFNLPGKFRKYEGVDFFDELWFFTDIPSEKKYLHYKCKNDLTIKQKFFGIDEEGEIASIKPRRRSSRISYIIETWERMKRESSR
jgi:hypothetical protein